MIENEKQLRHTYEQLARMYHLRDLDAAETLYAPDLRDSIVESTDMMIRKLEKEVAEYLAKQSQRAA